MSPSAEPVKQAVRRSDGTFGPRQSGNPKGRAPNELCFPPIYRRLLSSNDSFAEAPANHAEAICRSMIAAASAGDSRAAQLIQDRVDGKSKETVDHNVSGMPDRIEVVFVTPENGGKK